LKGCSQQARKWRAVDCEQGVNVGGTNLALYSGMVKEQLSTQAHEKFGELWVPRTMWEKRRQLSGVIHRSLMLGQRVAILACDDWTTFFNRVDLDHDSADQALAQHQMEYLQVKPVVDRAAVAGSRGTDLSRILGQLGSGSAGLPRMENNPRDRVVVDDVDLMIDLQSPETATASTFALVYALKSRFKDIILFSNPIPTDQALNTLKGVREFLVLHSSLPQNAA
jgi:hypothetical protein